MKFKELVTLLLAENFTNSGRTPPYIETCLSHQLLPNFGNYGKTLSDYQVDRCRVSVLEIDPVQLS